MKRAFAFLVVVSIVLTQTLFASDVYAPPPESAGGWRWCKTPDEVRSLAGMDPDKLNLIRDRFLQLFAGPWQIVIILSLIHI